MYKGLVKQLLIAAVVLTAGMLMHAPPAFADRLNNIPSNIQSESTSTIALLYGLSYLSDDGSSVFECVAFENLGTRAATAIDVEMTQEDSLGQEVSSDSEEIDGLFSPNVRIEPPLSSSGIPLESKFCFHHPTQSKLKSIRYHITKVKWADGSVWTPGSPFPFVLTFP